ncbi:hypothetical protein [Haliea sp.]
MRLRFLCPHHRSLIETDPSRARSSWELSHSKALEFRQRGATEQSIAAAGCALEAAEALLVLHGCRSEQDLRCFTDSAVLLRQTLPALRQAGLVRGLLAGCHARLEALMADGADKRLVLECCQRLSLADAQGTNSMVLETLGTTVH